MWKGVLSTSALYYTGQETQRRSTSFIILVIFASQAISSLKTEEKRWFPQGLVLCRLHTQKSISV